MSRHPTADSPSAPFTRLYLWWHHISTQVQLWLFTLAYPTGGLPAVHASSPFSLTWLGFRIYKGLKWGLRHTIYRGQPELERLLRLPPISAPANGPMFLGTEHAWASGFPPPQPSAWLWRVQQCLTYSQTLQGPCRLIAATTAGEPDWPELTQAVLQAKGIPLGTTGPGFTDSYAVDAPLISPPTPTEDVKVRRLAEALRTIWQVNMQNRNLAQRKRTPVMSTNAEQRRQLAQFREALASVGRSSSPPTGTASTNDPAEGWQALGFQSRADPTTDFRGMGQLGLDALVYYTQHHSDSAQLVLKCSRDHPTAWYSFAIVGINLAALAWRLYQSPEFQYYVYTTSLPIETVYFEFFSYLFHMFNDFWFTPQELNHLSSQGISSPLALLSVSPPKHTLQLIPLSLRYRHFQRQGSVSSISQIKFTDTKPNWSLQPPYTIMDFESVIPDFEAIISRQLYYRQVQPFIQHHPFALSDTADTEDLSDSSDLDSGSVAASGHKKDQ